MHFDLNTIWFALVGILFTGYAILDGFDLGVGALHLFAKKDVDRRILLNAIGPVWDGNEVWLVTGGGALFAAFPHVYATAFSGFYEAFMLLLAALIFRAVAIEFRSKEPWKWWRTLWDVSFSLGSITSSFLIGVAIGNVLWGISLDNNFEYSGGFLALLHPYALFVGVTTVALFMMHGAIYLVMKTEGDLQKTIKTWVRPCIAFFITCYIVFNIATVFHVHHVERIVPQRPFLLFILLLDILIVMNIPREIHFGRYFKAFLSSCVAMVLLMLLFGCTMYPNMIFSNPNIGNSLNIYNAASTQKTLKIMLIIAIIGVPIVLAYTVSIYWIFRGKVKLTEESY